MDEEKFWKIIENVHDGHGTDMRGKSVELQKELSRMQSKEAEQFSYAFDEKMDRAYSHILWGAAYLIHGGCGDDTFSDFRASLISRGQQAFEAATTNPDSLALEEYDDEAWFYEGYQYAVTEGVKKAVGSVVDRQSPYPNEPSGEAWEETQEYFQNSYPKLWGKFGDSWDVPAEINRNEPKPWWKLW